MLYQNLKRSGAQKKSMDAQKERKAAPEFNTVKGIVFNWAGSHY